jgi:glucose/arabinose dehydrogenase
MRRTVVVAFVVAFVAALTACGSGASKGSTGTTGTRPAITDPATTTTSVPGSTTAAQAPDFAQAKIRLTLVTAGLDRPVALAARHGTNTLYVANQVGDIRAIVGGHLSATRVLDLRGTVSTGTEQGLLGITFSPDGTHLYVDFTDANGDTRVQEFAMNGDVADVATRRQVLFVKQPFPNHNGGEVLTGPDGMLYIGLGDGGSEGDPMNNGQNKNTLLSKILRIDPQATATGPYSVPANNPFVHDPNARPETWDWGLRNPWRFSFDRATGDLWIGDVGQNAWEEIDYAKAETGGLNFGWSLREGTHKYKGDRPPGEVDPVYEYSHAAGGVAVTGGYVYRGTRIPNLVGAYVFSDYAEGDITALRQHNGRVTAHRLLDDSITDGISSFGEDNNGELYVLDLGGRLWRIDPF